MKTVLGRTGLGPEDGPAFVVVGVFDGIHLGHAYLLEQLVRVSRERGARPTVITFDAHPDAVLTGHAPALLMDPHERLERLAAAGIEIVLIEHFDDALRLTPYDVFVRGITSRCALAGILMTPDAAFGHDRAGTPTTVAALGALDGFEVVVVPPFGLDGHEVRSSEIRAAIATGNFGDAERLLGRPYAVVGDVDADGRMTFAMPVALPPTGEYPVGGGATGRVTEGGTIELGTATAPGRIRLELRRQIG
jgi:riboflavin kinase / FMN adenylyltransferase